MPPGTYIMVFPCIMKNVLRALTINTKLWTKPIRYDLANLLNAQAIIFLSAWILCKHSECRCGMVRTMVTSGSIHPDFCFLYFYFLISFVVCYDSFSVCWFWILKNWICSTMCVRCAFVCYKWQQKYIFHTHTEEY